MSAKPFLETLKQFDVDEKAFRRRCQKGVKRFQKSDDENKQELANLLAKIVKIKNPFKTMRHVADTAFNLTDGEVAIKIRKEEVQLGNLLEHSQSRMALKTVLEKCKEAFESRSFQKQFDAMFSNDIRYEINSKENILKGVNDYICRPAKQILHYKKLVKQLEKEFNQSRDQLEGMDEDRQIHDIQRLIGHLKDHINKLVKDKKVSSVKNERAALRFIQKLGDRKEYYIKRARVKPSSILREIESIAHGISRIIDKSTDRKSAKQVMRSAVDFLEEMYKKAYNSSPMFFKKGKAISTQARVIDNLQQAKQKIEAPEAPPPEPR